MLTFIMGSLLYFSVISTSQSLTLKALQMLQVDLTCCKCTAYLNAVCIFMCQELLLTIWFLRLYVSLKYKVGVRTDTCLEVTPTGVSKVQTYQKYFVVSLNHSVYAQLKNCKFCGEVVYVVFAKCFPQKLQSGEIMHHLILMVSFVRGHRNVLCPKNACQYT